MRNIITILSIKLSTFRDECKIPKLNPIFKKGTRNDAKNYRPISLLSLVSKTIKKLIHFQIESYLNNKKNLYVSVRLQDEQFNRPFLAQLTNFVATGINKQMYTGMILVDLQKAFDTLGHAVLLEKMKYLGFCTSVINWFESYLSNRMFLVCVDVFSEAGLLKYDVPQGSILRPLLFLLYVTGLPE